METHLIILFSYLFVIFILVIGMEMSKKFRNLFSIQLFSSKEDRLKKVFAVNGMPLFGISDNWDMVSLHLEDNDIKIHYPDKDVFVTRSDCYLTRIDDETCLLTKINNKINTIYLPGVYSI